MMGKTGRMRILRCMVVVTMFVADPNVQRWVTVVSLVRCVLNILLWVV